MREEEPPRDDVAVPGVHDRLDVLIEEIAVDDQDLHDAIVPAIMDLCLPR